MSVVSVAMLDRGVVLEVGPEEIVIPGAAEVVRSKAVGEVDVVGKGAGGDRVGHARDSQTVLPPERHARRIRADLALAIDRALEDGFTQRVEGLGDAEETGFHGVAVAPMDRGREVAVLVDAVRGSCGCHLGFVEEVPRRKPRRLHGRGREKRGEEN